jgi:hypothetical protein
MTRHRTMEARAEIETPFGGYVEVGPVKGIAKRPHQAGERTAYAVGDLMTVMTEGGCQGLDGWVEMRRGKLIVGERW